MRVAIAFGLLAVAAAANAKPVDVNGMDQRASAQALTYRMQSVAACMSAHSSVTFAAQNCQCAIDRFIAGRNPAGLPSVRDYPKLLDEHFAACQAERAGSQAPTSATAEADRGAKDPEAAAAPGPWAQLRGLDPAGWLDRSGLPAWAWAAIAGFALLLVLTLRGRRPRGDLIAPPRSLGPSPRVNPVVDDRAPGEDAGPGG